MKTIIKSLSEEKNALAKRISNALEYIHEEIMIAPFGTCMIVISENGAYDVRMYGAEGELDISAGWASPELCWLYANAVAMAVNLSPDRIIFDYSISPDWVEDLKNRPIDEMKILWEDECEYSGLMLGEIVGFKPEW